MTTSGALERAAREDGPGVLATLVRHLGGDLALAEDALQLPDTATTVRVRNDETLLTDGPFAETKEILGGYYLIDVPDLDAALGWAAKMPNIAYGSVEVRPVMVFDNQPA